MWEEGGKRNTGKRAEEVPKPMKSRSRGAIDIPFALDLRPKEDSFCFSLVFK